MEAEQINSEAETRAAALAKELEHGHENGAVELIAWCKVTALLAVMGDVSWTTLIDVMTTAYESGEAYHRARKG